MTGNKCLLSYLQSSNQDFVTFRDGAKETVLRTGSLITLSMYKLGNVLLVNPIRVSQLCNQNLLVKFTKDRYTVHDQFQYQIMEETRSSYNFYLLTNFCTCLSSMSNYQSS